MARDWIEYVVQIWDWVVIEKSVTPQERVLVLREEKLMEKLKQMVELWVTVMVDPQAMPAAAANHHQDLFASPNSHTINQQPQRLFA